MREQDSMQMRLGTHAIADIEACVDFFGHFRK